MTTATDWDVQDADTGSHAIVTDVTSAATDGAPVYTGEEAVAVRKLNAQLTDQMRRLDAENVRLSAAYEQARADLETLRAELHPLDARRTGWTPGPKAMPAKHWSDVNSVADLTEQQQRAALVAPTLPELRDGDGEDYLGAAIAAELMAGVDAKPGWPTWLGQVHHADAAWADIVTRLRAMPDTYAAAPVERTVVEPLAVDTSYRETEAWALADMVLAGRDRETGDVLAGPYSALAPERIQDSPADESGQNREATSLTTPERASGRGGGAETAQSPLNGPEDRQPSPPGASNRSDVEAMAEGRRRRDTLATRSSDDAVTTPQQRPWWRREWVAATGVGVMWAGFMAYAVAHAMGVLA